MPTPRTDTHRPDGPGAPAPEAVEAALCGLLQVVHVDPQAVRLTLEEADALFSHLRRERGQRGSRTSPI